MTSSPARINFVPKFADLCSQKTLPFGKDVGCREKRIWAFSIGICCDCRVAVPEGYSMAIVVSPLQCWEVVDPQRYAIVVP